MQVSAKTEDGKSVTVDFEFGDTLKDKVDKFGEDVVNSHAHRTFVLSLQSWLRSQLKSGKSPDEIKENLKTWQPGQRKTPKSAADKAREILEQMSPEERAEFKKSLRGA